MKFFIYFFLLLVINIKSQSVDFGDYVYWDKIKYDLINNPNLNNEIFVVLPLIIYCFFVFINKN